jgi:hypothetical protein
MSLIGYEFKQASIQSECALLGEDNCYSIGDYPSIVSEYQRNGSLMGQGQDYGVDG